MYGKHVILFDTLNNEQHDALVVGEQAAEQDGPKELLTLAYLRKDAPRAATHEHRILYAHAVRPKNHLDVIAGKVLHYYELPNETALAAREPARYYILLDGNILNGGQPASELVGVVKDGEPSPVSIAEVKVGDVLALGPYPEGSTVTSIADEEEGGVIEVICTSNPKLDAAPQTGDQAPAADPATTDEQAAPAETEAATA